MRRNILLFLFCILGASLLYAETPVSSESGKILFVYEESNEQLDPWIARMENYLNRQGIPFDKMAAAEASSLELEDFSSYRGLVLYGAVMAFTSNEPLRDWLKEEPSLQDQKVLLLVTANRWFLPKYTRQLKSLLKDEGAELIDDVTAVTKDLSEEEKDALLQEQWNQLDF